MPLTKYTDYLITWLKSDPHRTSTPYYFSADLAISIFYGWWLIIWTFIHTAAFTYYYDPVILQNKLTPLSIFRYLALRKRDSKKIIVYFYVFYWVYTNILKLYGLVVYSFMVFLGDIVACVRFGTKNQYSSDFRNQ